MSGGGFTTLGAMSPGDASARMEKTRHAYRMCLPPEGVAASLVWDDLNRFCMGGSSSFVPGDPHMTAFNEGKRAALLYIAAMAAPMPIQEG